MFGVDDNIKISEEENFDIQCIGWYYLNIHWMQLSNPNDKDIEWRQDILQF